MLVASMKSGNPIILVDLMGMADEFECFMHVAFVTYDSNKLGITSYTNNNILLPMSTFWYDYPKCLYAQISFNKAIKSPYRRDQSTGLIDNT